MSDRLKSAIVFGMMVELSFCGFMVLGVLAGFNFVCSSGTTPLGSALVFVGVLGHWPTGFLLSELFQDGGAMGFLGLVLTPILQTFLWSWLYWFIASFRNEEQEIKEQELKEQQRIRRIQRWTAFLEREREKFQPGKH